MKKFFKKSIAVFLILAMVGGAAPLVFAVSDNEQKMSSINDISEITAENALAPVIEKGVLETQENSKDDYGIVDLKWDGKVATVDFVNKTECVIVVAIYTEDGKLIASEKKSAFVDAAELEISIVGVSLPRYYVIKAFMLDENNNALCEDYINLEFTEYFENFRNKSVNDFAGDIVINLDEDPKNNFMVVEKNAIDATNKNGYNILVSSDFENGMFVFENIDNSILSLKEGDVLYHGENPLESIIVKVKSIEIQGKKAIIQSDKDAELSELFSFVKVDIDPSDENSGMTVDMTDADQGVSFKGIENYDNVESQSNDDITTQAVDFNPVVTVGPKWDLEISDHIEGHIKAGITLDLKVYYDVYGVDIKLKFWESEIDDYFYFHVKFDIKITGDIEVKKAFESKGITLGSVDFMTPVGVTCGVYFDLVFKASGAIKLEIVEISVCIGTKYDENIGSFKSLCTPPKAELLPTVESEVEFSVGFQPTPNITVLKVVEAGLEVEFGVKVSVTVFKVGDNDKKHLCTICFPGKISLYLDVEISASIISKKLAAVPLYGKADIGLLNFHINLDNGFDFNWGLCENWAYKVDFVVSDSTDKKVIGAVIDSGSTENSKKVNNNSLSVITGSNGEAYFFYPKGRYTATCVAEGCKEAKQTFTVVPNVGKKVYFKLEGEAENQETTTTPDNPGGSVGNISWNYNSTTKTITLTGSGNMVDYASLTSSPWHQYYEEAEKIVINSGITSIGNYAFAQFRNVSEIDIPTTVTKIGMGAFYGCNYLQSIFVGDNVKSIGDYAFFACQSAKNIYIGSSVETIGKYAFAQCQAVSAINVPVSVTSVGASAFKHCTNLKSITFMNSSCKIGDTEDTIFYGATIYGGSNSTAKTYASKYSRSFVTISTAKVATLSIEANGLSTQGIGTGYYAKTSGAYSGEEYVLVVVKKSVNGIALDSDSLLYIDQKTAESDGDISFAFIPKTNDDCVAYIIGRFSGATQMQIEHQSTSKPVQIMINNLPLKTSYIYKEGNIELNGIVVTAIYYDGSTEIIEIENINVDNFDTSSTGTKPVVISYKGTSASYDIKVSYAWWQWLIRIFLLGFIWY